jgi:hypothetical protein
MAAYGAAEGGGGTGTGAGMRVVGFTAVVDVDTEANSEEFASAANTCDPLAAAFSAAAVNGSVSGNGGDPALSSCVCDGGCGGGCDCDCDDDDDDDDGTILLSMLIFAFPNKFPEDDDEEEEDVEDKVEYDDCKEEGEEEEG